MSPRKLSHGTSRSMASSGSPFAESPVSRLSASKNPNCPIVRLRESCRQAADSHECERSAIFRGALNYYVRQSGNHLLICARNSVNMAHVRELAKLFGAFKNSIDY